MTTFKMPPAAGVLRSDEFDGHVFEPVKDWPFGNLYTAEALRDVLEQAALVCEAKGQAYGMHCAMHIRAMKEQIK
jgi:hypothetical protein